MKGLQGLALKASRLKVALIEQAKKAKKDFSALSDIIEKDGKNDESLFLNNITEITEFAQTVRKEKIKESDSPAVFAYLKESKDLIAEEKDKYSMDVRMKANTAIEIIESIITLSEPYTFENAPEWVKELPLKAKDAWIKAFNSALSQYNDEGKAFATANSMLKKMGYKKKGDRWIKEAGGTADSDIIEITEAGIDGEFVVDDYLSLKEASYDKTNGIVEAVLIEAGTNYEKKRHYPVSTIREAAPIFKGLKMYINHPTSQENNQRPERDLRDYVSTIVESRAEGGKAIGTIVIHDKDLRERMENPVFRNNVGLSINMGGRVSIGKVNGQTMQIVEKIFRRRQNGPASVDWVTEPGARGRVTKLLESNRKDDEMKIEELTLKEIQESRPDLLEAYVKSLKEGKALEKAQSELQEANKKIAEFEKAESLRKQGELIETALKESKLPDVAKNRIKTQIAESGVVYETEEKLKETISGMVKTELEYINQFSKKGKIKTGASTDGNEKSLVESFENDLVQIMGLEEKKSEE